MEVGDQKFISRSSEGFGCATPKSLPASFDCSAKLRLVLEENLLGSSAMSSSFRRESWEAVISLLAVSPRKLVRKEISLKKIYKVED